MRIFQRPFRRAVLCALVLAVLSARRVLADDRYSLSARGVSPARIAWMFFRLVAAPCFG